MISIKKPARAPKILRERGKKARKDVMKRYTDAPVSFQRGTSIFEFDRSLYAARSVKKALLSAQHDKCCFCESKISHISHGDIEHFRPKGGWRQRPAGKLKRPGYYWLAYEWSNLLVSCELCNQRYKENLFPLSNPRSRARDHHHEVSREKPLFIDPATEDPTRYISFRQEHPYAVRNSRRGRATITALGLDREALAEQRRRRLDFIRALKTIELELPNTKESRKARRLLKSLQRDDAEYAAMVRAYLD